MSSLSWFRAARKVVGLSAQVDYPSLEALLEAEEGQPHEDYRLLARTLPPIVGVLVAGTFIPFAFTHHPFVSLFALTSLVFAPALWYICDRMDKSMTPSKRRIRKTSEEIWARYRSLKSIVGVEPALSHNVGQLLDEAAFIYQKHFTPDKPVKNPSEPYARALNALEEAMARMLELGKPASVQAQELELASGWAKPLLQEMRDMDRALEHHRQAAAATELLGGSDPIAGLREARLELQRTESAMIELEQHRS